MLQTHHVHQWGRFWEEMKVSHQRRSLKARTGFQKFTANYTIRKHRHKHWDLDWKCISSFFFLERWQTLHAIAAWHFAWNHFALVWPSYVHSFIHSFLWSIHSVIDQFCAMLPLVRPDELSCGRDGFSPTAAALVAPIVAVQLVASPHNMTQGSSRLLPWQLPVNIRGRPVESGAVSCCLLLDKLIGRSCGRGKKGRQEGGEGSLLKCDTWLSRWLGKRPRQPWKMRQKAIRY